LILDNLSAPQDSQVASFLEQHPNVKLHFTTPLFFLAESVEIFSRIERDVIARGVSISVRDLARKLIRCIRAYSKTAPFPLEGLLRSSQADGMLTNSPRHATSHCSEADCGIDDDFFPR
jgi:hypothetical protein